MRPTFAGPGKNIDRHKPTPAVERGVMSGGYIEHNKNLAEVNKTGAQAEAEGGRKQKFDPVTGHPIPKFDPDTGAQNW